MYLCVREESTIMFVTSSALQRRQAAVENLEVSSKIWHKLITESLKTVFGMSNLDRLDLLDASDFDVSTTAFTDHIQHRRHYSTHIIKDIKLIIHNPDELSLMLSDYQIAFFCLRTPVAIGL
ncbi:hypothetical protein DINM_005300 [Dirofilaria immitis]|nr:hypothetical protein [Dirofilaria immitis]